MVSQDKLSNKTLYRNTKQEPIVEDLLDENNGKFNYQYAL